MARRPRADSLTAAVTAAGAQTVEPPASVPLEASDLPFFQSVIERFARSEWTPYAVQLAAMLARDMAALELLQRDIRAEGHSIISPKGHPCLNPKVSAANQLRTGILALGRSLSLNARAQGKPSEIARRNEHLKAVERALEDEGEGLLN